MSKKIEIKNKRWSGSVTIADPLTIPQAKLIEAGNKQSPEIEQILSDLADAKEKHGEESDEVKKLAKQRVSLFLYDDLQLPAILACVEKWEIPDFPEPVTLENFPASPRHASHKLIEQIFMELLVVYFGESEIPNA